MNTFYIQTLGCKVNQYESDKMKEILCSFGLKEIESANACDLHIINTCTVTNLADKKSRQKLRQAISANPNAKIIVTGCGVKNKNSKLDIISGNFIILKKKDGFESLIKSLLNNKNNSTSSTFKSKNRAFLKIGDGCDRFCTYCIVPYVRGKIISKPFNDVIKEAETLARSGSKEIVLTSIHLGAYGKETETGESLAELLEKLAKLLPCIRFRLSSLEPLDFCLEILEVIKNNPNICRHIHLPLQHASNAILKTMNRKYTKENYREIIEKIKAVLPSCEFTTDVIVGFPGETEKDFEELCDFIKEISFLKCHIFKYSKRNGTPAAGFEDQIQEGIKQDRSKKLIKICESITQSRHEKLIGKTTEILAEEKQDELWTGFTENYIRVYFKSQDNFKNKFINLKIIKYENGKLLGEIVGG